MLTPQQATGMIANLLGENRTLDVHQFGDRGHALGIAQWRDDGTPKRQKIFKEAFHHDMRLSSLEEQARFILYELAHKESHAKKEIMKTRTVKEAVDSAVEKYERPQSPSKDKAIREKNIPRVQEALQHLGRQVYLDRKRDVALYTKRDVSNTKQPSMTTNHVSIVVNAPHANAHEVAERLEDHFRNLNVAGVSAVG
ncbi:hypothetical protein COMNV_00841 [Commensalibacter sp. Nvir]|nr:hypothetical protein COMNV_00841 [Commensalibacter sp. Nvir]